MIRLAAMTSVFPDWTLEEAILALKRHGYGGLEARVEWGHKSGIEAGLTSDQRAEVRHKVDGAGLAVGVADRRRAAGGGEPGRHRSPGGRSAGDGRP